MSIIKFICFLYDENFLLCGVYEMLVFEKMVEKFNIYPMYIKIERI
jgi:hypothetical protein